MQPRPHTLFAIRPPSPELRPLVHHPRPLPNGKSRPRSPLVVRSEERAGFVEAVAGEQQPLDVPAVFRPQFDLEEVAPVGDQRVVGLLAKGVVQGVVVDHLLGKSGIR
jgi:hypothetical protein